MVLGVVLGVVLGEWKTFEIILEVSVRVKGPNWREVMRLGGVEGTVLSW